MCVQTESLMETSFPQGLTWSLGWWGISLSSPKVKHRCHNIYSQFPFSLVSIVQRVYLCVSGRVHVHCTHGLALSPGLSRFFSMLHEKNGVVWGWGYIWYAPEKKVTRSSRVSEMFHWLTSSQLFRCAVCRGCGLLTASPKVGESLEVHESHSWAIVKLSYNIN